MNDAPRMVNHTDLTLAVGSRRLVDTSVLAYTDSDSAPQNILYIVDRRSPAGQLEHIDTPGVALLRFTQQEVNDQKVLFSHHGNKMASVTTMQLMVSDLQSHPQEFELRVVAFVGQVSLVTKRPVNISYKSAAMLSPFYCLAYTSFEDQRPKPTTVYTIVREPMTGYVVVADSSGPFHPSRQFTQDDINASRVLILHNSSTPHTEDSMVVRLHSGRFTPDDLHTINIEIELPDPTVRPQVMIKTKMMAVTEDDSKRITKDYISVDLVPRPIQYGQLDAVLDSGFQFGSLLITPENLGTRHIRDNRFRIDQIHPSLTYLHGGEESTFDNVTFCVEAAGSWPPEVKQPIPSCGHVFSVKVLPYNDKKPKVSWTDVSILVLRKTFNPTTATWQIHPAWAIEQTEEVLVSNWPAFSERLSRDDFHSKLKNKTARCTESYVLCQGSCLFSISLQDLGRNILSSG